MSIPVSEQIGPIVHRYKRLLECWLGISTKETIGKTFCIGCKYLDDCEALYTFLAFGDSAHPATLAKNKLIAFGVKSEYLMRRNKYDSQTYYIVVARDTDMEGVTRCVHCGSIASEVHEILPRSFFAKGDKRALFDVKNRCCLCRDCHGKLHNDRGRATLLRILVQRHGYKYDGRAAWLLSNFETEE